MVLSIGDKGQQRNLAGALNRLSQLALVHGTGSSGAAGQNLGPLRQETAQFRGVFIVDVLHFVHTEGADLTALTAAGTLSIHSHNRETSFSWA